MRLSILCAVLFAVGCVGTGTADVQYGGGVSISTPDLVEVEPGVQVVADYDEPIFYTDGFYWRYDGGGWYRSNNYATGFVYYSSPPVTVTRISAPERYVHYRPANYVVHNRPQRRPEPIVRDHRAPAPARVERHEEPRHEEPRHEEPRHEEPRRAPEPVVRDHREPVREAPHAPPAPPVRDHRDDDKDKDKKHH